MPNHFVHVGHGLESLQRACLAMTGGLLKAPALFTVTAPRHGPRMISDDCEPGQVAPASQNQRGIDARRCPFSIG